MLLKLNFFVKKNRRKLKKFLNKLAHSSLFLDIIIAILTLFSIFEAKFSSNFIKFAEYSLSLIVFATFLILFLIYFDKFYESYKKIKKLIKIRE